MNGGELINNALYGLPSSSSQSSLSHIKTAALITTALSSQQNDDSSGQRSDLLPLALGGSQSSTSSSLTVLPINNVNLAQANEFNELISSGAISKAGGLPHTSEIENSYIKFAEKKILRDNSLDHYSVLWELGTGITEQLYLSQHLAAMETSDSQDDSEGAQLQKAAAQGGLGFDSEKEDKLISNMKEWFIAGGGTLKYIEPVFDHYTKYYRLKATENVFADESVVNIPFKLIMCRQTARNVLIKQKSKLL